MPREKKAEQGCPLWMMTFGDCMSLLVTFFVMLIAFSNLEEAQLIEVLGAMKGALGVKEEERPQDSPELVHYERSKGVSERKQWLTLEELSAVMPDVKLARRRYGRPRVEALGRKVIVRMIEEGLVFVVDASGIFEEGGSDFRPHSDTLLARIGAFISGLPNEVQIVAIVDESQHVEGQGYSTPWGLGILRANLVLDWFATLTNGDTSRYGIGVRSSDSPYHAAAEASLPTDPPDANWPDRLEISVRGARIHVDRSPDEIVADDDWGMI
jgi:chemotaxis protein MotB